MEQSEIKEVILVDSSDNEIGRMEKMEAHQKGLLHRAFSVFIFNSEGELLLQKRAEGKYHSENLWTNTCCSHPAPGESVTDAAKRRLQEEMGFICELVSTYSFIYNVSLDNGLKEHELDHIIIGSYNDNPVLNPEEASAYKWMKLADVKNDMGMNSSSYTSWFTIIMNEHYTKLTELLNNL